MRRIWTSLVMALALGTTATAQGQAPLPAEPPGACDPCPAPPISAGSGLFAEASIYGLRPGFTANPAYTIYQANTSLPRVVTAGNSTVQQDWDVRPAFAVSVGWAGSGDLGVRSRYFQFDQRSSQLSAGETQADVTLGTAITPPDFGLPGTANGVARFGSPGTLIQATSPLGQDFLTFTSSLTIHAVDVEALSRHDLGAWVLLAAAGGRFLRLEHLYGATLLNPGAPGTTEVQTLLNERRFTGGGPTVALEAARRLGGSGFALFGNLRGSYLLGQFHDAASFSQHVNDTARRTLNGSQSTVTGSSACRTAVLPVVEVEIGGEYQLSLGRTTAVIRLAAVNQTYFDAGSASQANGNTSLFGGQGSVGLHY